MCLRTQSRSLINSDSRTTRVTTINTTSSHRIPSLPYQATEHHQYHIHSPNTIATISSHRTPSLPYPATDHDPTSDPSPPVLSNVYLSKWKARFYTFTGNKYICIVPFQLNSNRSCNEHIKLNSFLTIRSKLCKRNTPIVLDIHVSCSRKCTTRITEQQLAQNSVFLSNTLQ